MIPNIFIIGKFNTGKSIFFNNINYSKKNLSFKFKNSTLNIKKIFNIYKNLNYFTYDTSGFNFFFDFKFKFKLKLYESDIIFFFIDSFIGLYYEDKYILNLLKTLKKCIFLVINKIDFLNLNINIFHFYKFFKSKPYIISSSNKFNNFYIINSIMNIYCFYKKCFHYNLKFNNLRVFLLFYNKFQLRNFINNFFLKNKLFYKCKDLIYFFLKILKFNLCFISSFFFNLNFKNFLKKFMFLNTLKNIILSEILYFFINPFYNFKNFFYIKFLLKIKLKFLVLVLNYLDLLNLKFKIYFLNYFKKKYSLNHLYMFYISIFKKFNFFYFSYYILKYFKIINKKIKISKFLFNFNNFLIFKKKLNFKIFKIKQKDSLPILIKIRNNHFKKYLKILNILKFNLNKFFKIKSILIFFEI